jgi:large subunit ribosomal protein L30
MSETPQLDKPEAAAAGKPRSQKRAAGASPAAAGAGRLTLRQIRSGICAPKDQKATLAALGFKRRGQQVVREDRPEVRGMIRKVRHLVEVVKE